MKTLDSTHYKCIPQQPYGTDICDKHGNFATRCAYEVGEFMLAKLRLVITLNLLLAYQSEIMFIVIRKFNGVPLAYSQLVL